MIICAKMNTIILFRKTNVLSRIILFICLVQSTQSDVLDWFGNPTEPQNSTEDGSDPLNNGSDPLNNGSDPLGVLRCVCDIRNAASKDVSINTLPEYCTAVATSSNKNADVKAISSARTTDIPFILYFNGFTYEQWNYHLNDIQSFIGYMKEFRVDGYIFDRMYSYVINDAGYDAVKNQAIYTFFQNLKQANPQGLFGLALPRNADLLPTAFNYTLLDPVVDFYVIQTLNYRFCVFEPVVKMKRTCTIGDMRKSLNALRQATNLQKVLLTVQVFSIGITPNAKHGPAIISYSDGQLVVEFGMLGVYIKFIDYDDFAGSCGCATTNGDNKFPATAAIVAGMDPNATAPDFCDDFGNYDDTSADSAAEADN